MAIGTEESRADADALTSRRLRRRARKSWRRRLEVDAPLLQGVGAELELDVVTASNGKEALDLLEQGVRRPRDHRPQHAADGRIELTRKIRANFLTQDIRS